VNVLLLEPGELAGGARVRLTDRRFEHVRRVLRARVGDEILVGEVDGRLGPARVRAIDDAALELEVALDRDPPAPLPVRLVAALPRPPSLRKLLQQATSLGVKCIALIDTARVEPSFWQSSALRPQELGRQLRLGLEQARDTALPRVELHRRFDAFVRAELPRFCQGTLLLAEPGAPAPPRAPGPVTLLLGPEGGLLPREVAALRAAGAQPVGVGERALRVETAAVALLGALAARGGCG
jgi:RsmE family RNA methyltransferase